MGSCITTAAVASLLLAAGGPNTGPGDGAPVPGWSLATKGGEIPRDQDAGGFAAGIDRGLTHAERASILDFEATGAVATAPIPSWRFVREGKMGSDTSV
jgi:hypothetical protein